VFIRYLLPLFAVIALLANVIGGLRHRHRASVDRCGALLLLIGPCRDRDCGYGLLSNQRCAALLETEAAHPYLPGTS
jgi:hypothetical protein